VLLKLYSHVFFLVELGVGITAVLYKKDLEPVVQKMMQEQMDNYGKMDTCVT
jgi:hypothetical protein